MGLDLLNAVLSLDAYRELADRPWSRSLGHLALLVAVVLLLAGPSMALRFYGWARLGREAADGGWPTLIFRHGRLRLEGIQPAALVDGSRVLVLNPNSLPAPPFTGRVLFFARRGVYYRSPGGREYFTPYPDRSFRLSPETLTKLIRLWPLAFVATGVLLWAAGLAVLTLLTTTLALLGHLLSLALRRQSRFSQIWNIAAYGQTLPVLLFFLNERLPDLQPLQARGAAPVPQFPLVYLLLSLIYLLAGLRRLPRSLSNGAEKAV